MPDTIFLIGCGGGFDICSGFMLYQRLTKKGHRVVLGNYSFTDDLYLYRDTPAVPVTAATVPTAKNKDYFPERIMAIATGQTVYAFRLYGPAVLAKAIDEICVAEDVDRIILVDAGCDSLLFGYEDSDLGSPLEDMSMLTACALAGAIPVDLCCVAVTCDEPYVHFDQNLKMMNALGGLLAIIDPAGWDGIEQYRAMLDLSSHHSIPNEQLWASISGGTPKLDDRKGAQPPDGRAEQGGLGGRAAPPFPAVTDQTRLHYVFNARVLARHSKMIGYMCDDLTEFHNWLKSLHR